LSFPTSGHLGRYFAGLLDKLGYRASARVLGDNDFSLIPGPRSEAQIGFVGQSADYLAASTSSRPTSPAPPQASRQLFDASYVCDRAGSAGRPGAALAAQSADAPSAGRRSTTG
jgi:hypothetical protein